MILESIAMNTLYSRVEVHHEQKNEQIVHIMIYTLDYNVFVVLEKNKF